MTPYTQARSADEIARIREFQRQGMVPFCGAWTPEELAWASVGLAPPESPDWSNGGVSIDWLAINREFS